MTKPRTAATDETAMREDGIFKMLTWRSPALTGMFGLPAIAGEPLQQETHEPVERRLDRLYRLADGSYLHVEHQTSLRDFGELAERMIRYRVRIRSLIPRPATLHQIMIFSGRTPEDRARVPAALVYDDRSPLHGAGLTFSMPIRDLLVEPIARFMASGSIDDLMLGLLGPGRADPGYREYVASRIRGLDGEGQRDAKVKFIAICAMIGVAVDHLVGDVRMWIEDVRDSPIVREIVRIAGQQDISDAAREGHAKGLAEGHAEGLVEGHAEGLATAIVTIARSRGARVADGVVEQLVRSATDEALQRMIADERAIGTDLDAFVTAHGVVLPGSRTDRRAGPSSDA